MSSNNRDRNLHRIRPRWRLALAAVALLGLAGGAPQESLPQWDSVRDGLISEGTFRDRKEQLRQLTPVQLDELRRRKLTFEQLSQAERDRIVQLHRDLKTHPQGDQLRQVMRRYYDWLKTLDERERRELLRLPQAERLDRIREIRDRQARASFGRVGATKLPDEDVVSVYEWIQQTVSEKRDEIDALLQKPEIQQRLSSATRRSFAQPAINLRRSNFRFLWLANNAPEFAGPLVIEEFDKLRPKLSSAALEIIDDYGPQEQMDLIVQWYKAAYYAYTNVTDEKLFEFWQGLDQDVKEQMDGLSRAEWRRRLESRYFHSFYTSKGKLDEDDEGDVEWPGRRRPRRRIER